MLLPWATAAVLAVGQATLCAQQSQPETPAQLIREVVYNELQDHQAHGSWRYWVQRQREDGTEREDQVETTEGPITRLYLSNGRPLRPEFQKLEEARLQRLLGSTWEQARNRRDYSDEEERIGRILVMLPEAFLYEYDGEGKGCRRLSFRSNPAYVAQSVEARVFHALSGTLCVDTQYKRLVQIDGRLQENVDFGFGILGRLSKGGWFQLKRTQVSASEWKIEGVEVHFSGRAILFKEVSHDTSEVRGGFVQVPSGLNLAQGMKLLQQAPFQAEVQLPNQPPSAIPHITIPVFALRQ
jgi:hypothetical protein